MSQQYWWIPDDTEVWTLATQTGNEMPNGCVKFTSVSTKKLYTLAKSKCFPAPEFILNGNPPEDLVMATNVNPPTILYAAKMRFDRGEIYTSCGSVIMSLNPFQSLDGLYGNDVIQKYLNPYDSSLKSHVYLVPSRAYASLTTTGQSQSILISGESGSGKTEATKVCLSFITEVASKESGANISHIGEKIVAASPLLESFGNAKSVRNSNSSRFGKWMEILFDDNYQVFGSSIVCYMLEKSRVTQRDAQERNFHIFYELLRGISQDRLKEWNLSASCNFYRFIRSTKDDQEPIDLHDSKRFHELNEAFHVLGFSEQERLSIYQIIAGILHLGNIEFDDQDLGEASSVSKLDNSIYHAARLLQIAPESLEMALVTRIIETGIRRSVTVTKLNPQKASESRDCLARTLYEKVFHYLVDRINYYNNLNHMRNNNEGIHNENGVSNDSSLSTSLSTSSTTSSTTSTSGSNGVSLPTSNRILGLLDIFGFEIFPENSLEQFSINYCNEILQQHFNYVIFTAEKQLYASEEIPCPPMDFKDNQGILREMESLFKSLDEEGKIPKGSSRSWFDKCKRGPKLTHITCLARRDILAVKHYAGIVEYTPSQFLEKNIEVLQTDLVQVMKTSSCAIVAQLFTTPSTSTPTNTAPTTPTSSDKTGSSSSSASTASSNSTSPAARSSGVVSNSIFRRGGGSAGTSGGQGSSASNATSRLAPKSITYHFQSQLASLSQRLKSTSSHFIRCLKSNENGKPLQFDPMLVNRQLLYSGLFEVVRTQQSGLPCRLNFDDFVRSFRSLVPSDTRWKISTPGELVAVLRRLKYSLPSLQIGKTLVFFNGEEQNVLEGSKRKLIFQAAANLQKFARRKPRYRIYLRLRQYYREFQSGLQEFLGEKCEGLLKSMKIEVEEMNKLNHDDILGPFYQQQDQRLQLLWMQIDLLKNLETSFQTRSMDGMNQCEELLQLSGPLQLVAHPLIQTIKKEVSGYRRAEKFLEVITFKFEELKNWLVDELLTEMTILRQYVDVFPTAPHSLAEVEFYLQQIDDEMVEVYQPLLEAFRRALIRRDEVTGALCPVSLEAYLSEPSLATLEVMARNRGKTTKIRRLDSPEEHASQSPTTMTPFTTPLSTPSLFPCVDERDKNQQKPCLIYEEGQQIHDNVNNDEEESSIYGFLSRNTQLLLEDVQGFLQLRDSWAVKKNPIGMMQFIQSLTPYCEEFIQQLAIFSEWVDLELSTHSLEEALKRGKVPSSDTGEEEAVETTSLEVLLTGLKSLDQPSIKILSAIEVGEAILKVNK